MRTRSEMRAGRLRRVLLAVALSLASLAVVLGVLTYADEISPLPWTGPGDIDAVFVREVVAMDERTMSLARLATTHAEHAEVRGIARDIISTLQADSARMGVIQAGVLEQAGDGGERAALVSAPSFDKAFLEVMMGRYQAALELCRRALEHADEPDTRRTAAALIESRSRDLVVMRLQYDQWYGR